MPKWRTALSKTEPNKLIVRGYRIEDLMERVSFPEAIHLLFTGNLPGKKEARLINAILVAFIDYGIAAPSVRVSRIASSAGAALVPSAAAGLIAFSGRHHGGAVDGAVAMLSEGVKRSERDRISLARVADGIVSEHLREGRRISGFGHPLNKEYDPRTLKLYDLASRLGYKGAHCKLTEQIWRSLRKRGKEGLSINVDASTSAVLLDLGYSEDLVPAFNAIGRLVGLLAHSYEEGKRERPFRVQEMSEVVYDGEPEREIHGPNRSKRAFLSEKTR